MGLLVLTRQMTQADAVAEAFTGIRSDNLSFNYEIWVYGKLEATITPDQAASNPNALVDAYAKVFGLHPDQVRIG